MTRVRIQSVEDEGATTNIWIRDTGHVNGGQYGTVAGAGGVTSVTGTAPISSTGGSTPDISLNLLGVTTAYLGNSAVTFAKIQDLPTQTVIGRSAAGTGVTGAVTFSTIVASGGGLTPTDHKSLRQLIHLADGGGPFEGFASGAYLETLPAADPFPTSFIWWESAAKTEKIVEETVTYNANKTINTDEWKVYDTDGVTLLATVTDTIAYTTVFETSRTRVVT